VSVALDPSMSRDALAMAMRELTPRLVVVAGGDELAKLESAGGAVGVEGILVLDPVAPSPSYTSWADAMELGGTLDTAERAQAFRARARGLDAGRLALAAPDEGPGASTWKYLTHAQALAAIAAFQSRTRPIAGDVAYVEGAGSSLRARIPLLSFVGDGVTSTFVGTEGRESAELADVRPQILMVSGRVAADARTQVRPHTRRALREWLEVRFRPDHRESTPPARYRMIMTPDGAPAGLGSETNGR
jgi:hypothetical protein